MCGNPKENHRTSPAPPPTAAVSHVQNPKYCEASSWGVQGGVPLFKRPSSTSVQTTPDPFSSFRSRTRRIDWALEICLKLPFGGLEDLKPWKMGHQP